MDPLALVSIALFFVILLTIVALVVINANANKGQQQQQPQQQQPAETVINRGGRNVGLARMRVRQQPPRPNAEIEEAPEEEEQNENNNNNNALRYARGNIGRKRLEKLKRKEERRQFNEAIRNEQQRRREEKERQEAEEELALVEQEEKEKALRLEKEKREQEEYEKWKSLISVEETGAVHDDAMRDAEANSGLFQRFIKYIQDHKVVAFEDLAVAFKLRTEDVIKRVQELEAQGTITGIFDDRGKFIYITEDEMQAVAKFIKSRGRVAIAELSAESSKLINLESATTEGDE